MIVMLSEWLSQYVDACRVFGYLTFRAVMALFTALAISLALGPKIINFMHVLHYGQPVRDDGPQSHLKKQGTPTMGGVLIIGSIVVTVLMWCRWTIAPTR